MEVYPGHRISGHAPWVTTTQPWSSTMLIVNKSHKVILGTLTFAYFPDNWDGFQAEPTCSGSLFWAFVLHKRTRNTPLFTNWGYAPECTPVSWALLPPLCSEAHSLLPFSTAPSDLCLPGSIPYLACRAKH